MSTDTRGWAAAPWQVPAGPDRRQLARRARTVRRVTAVPFWGVFVSGALLLPWATLGRDSVWQVLSAVFTLPVSAVLLTIRAVPTHRFLASVQPGRPGQIGRNLLEVRGERRGQAFMAGAAVVVAPLLLCGATTCFAPQLLPTTPATATVTDCTYKGGGPGGPNTPVASCDGRWVVDRRTYQGSLPTSTARPGQQVPIAVRTDEPAKAFSTSSASNTLTGAGFGLFGLAIGLAGAVELVRRSRWLSAALSAQATGAPTPPAAV